MADWYTRELDATTGRAVALMSLYVGGTDADDAEAAILMEEFLAGANGPVRTIEGFEALCGALLVLLEFETGARPSAVLQRVGTMVAASEILGM